MELNNHYTETSGTGSGSILPDQINQSNVRLRRVARDIGYSVSIPAWKTCSPTIWTKVQSLAGAIVAFNILTLDSLQFASPGYEAVIGDGYEDYKTLLAKQTQLSGLSRIQSGAQLDTRVNDYLKTLGREQTMQIVLDTRTSGYYALLFNIMMRDYKIAKKDSERAQKNPSHVPAINYVDRGMRLDEYVDKAITTEQMTRCFLKNVISRSKGMLIIIREVIATEILALDLETMSILKQKVSAVNDNFSDAVALVDGPGKGHQLTKHLFHKYWWNSGLSPSKTAVTTPKTYKPPLKTITTLNFIAPSILLLSCIPISLAWLHTSLDIGSSADANFYQLISNSMIQLLSLATLLSPTLFYSKFSGYAWYWTWFLAVLSFVCTVLSLVLYCFVPVAWSMLIAFCGTVAQALILLQIVHAS
ncbi:hypothetical protein GLAREA_09852 [Glarea lozoyensis ATCC 20868]|uniref:Uncharacterized protein n=1 Tax=Glarea lozoyensis (strain ATCC 20868 / MF5171) TaxID=1116229 RepID=S3D9S8_GLAL2|nr:uncharacterized protein GLAREA_09852 [Glarea lozoyensis ATCC 20868]EPE28731.1 hypothetical protein GLAREA_09852 [Glarea lozoyensis ATCC 20868]